jgi:hypothetical protein
MDLQEAIKTTYENVGFAVIDVRPVHGTPVFEMEFVTPNGYCKKNVMTFFMLFEDPEKKNASTINQR